MRTITQKVFGGSEVLEVVDVPRPGPGPGEVLVRVEAVGLNPVEAAVRSGRFPLLGEPPFVLGWDVAGVVERVGPEVRSFAEGDRVFGLVSFPRQGGTNAEYVVAGVGDLVPVPAGVDPIVAGALPLAGLTAWQSLVVAGGLTAGQHVLIHAGGGGVGHLAVQIAKARGATVTATASADKVPFVRSLGADTVIDYRAEDLASSVQGPVDLAFDTVGADVAERSLDLLRPGGTLVTITRHTDAALRSRVEDAGRRFAGVFVEPDPAGLAALAELLTAGALRVHVERIYRLDEVAAAHERLLARPGLTGKLVLVP